MKCWPLRELCKPFPGSAAARHPVERAVVSEVCWECPSCLSSRTSLYISPFSGGQGGVGKMQETSHPFDTGWKRMWPCRGCNMALPEHGPMALLWPPPAMMGGGR